MDILKTKINATLQQFQVLKEAIIDASSIIYLKKIQIFDLLASTIHLLTCQAILNETGYSQLKLELLPENSNLTNDQKIVDLFIKHHLPVISEDKKILSEANKADLPYFNCLMMLNYLYYTECITKKQLQDKINLLKSFARYADKIYLYGEELFFVIEQEKRSQNSVKL
ncbi:MAG: hypothetical protein MJB14_03915 [Spirochaetes bacterium]|nr:hypothetical protein [Spirochaetota bacterium]